MAVLPLIEDIERECDATVDHQPWATPHPDGRDQADAMGTPLVDVEDVGFVASQVSPQPRGGNRVPWASKGKIEELETGVGTGRFKITAGGAPDPNVMSPAAKTVGCRQHLDRRASVQPVLFDQVEKADLLGHAFSIRVGFRFGRYIVVQTVELQAVREFILRRSRACEILPKNITDGLEASHRAFRRYTSAAVTNRRQRVAVGWPPQPSTPANDHPHRCPRIVDVIACEAYKPCA